MHSTESLSVGAATVGTRLPSSEEGNHSEHSALRKHSEAPAEQLSTSSDGEAPPPRVPIIWATNPMRTEPHRQRRRHQLRGPEKNEDRSQLEIERLESAEEADAESPDMRFEYSSGSEEEEDFSAPVAVSQSVKPIRIMDNQRQRLERMHAKFERSKPKDDAVLLLRPKPPAQGWPSQDKSPLTGRRAATRQATAAESAGVVADDDEPKTAATGAMRGSAGLSKAALRSLTRERKMPHYATTDFCAEHYFPETRPSGVGAFEVAPLVHSAGVDTLLQRDLTAAIIVLADKGDENKEVLGETGTIQEMLVLSESPDLEVRLNAVHSLSKLLTIDNNRWALYEVEGSIQRLQQLVLVRVVNQAIKQPAPVVAMRAATRCIAQLARTDSKDLKMRFVESGLVKPLCILTRSKDEDTRRTAATGLLWLCQTPGSTKDKWSRRIEPTDLEWETEHILMLVEAAESDDPAVTTQLWLGLRCLCTHQTIHVILNRTNLFDILATSLRGDRFKDHFTLLMAALLFIASLAETPWPPHVLESRAYLPMLEALARLLPRTEVEVRSMQSAKGVMSTWSEATLARCAAVVMANPDATMSDVNESYQQSFRQLQCYVLISDVVVLLESLMLQMKEIREGLFHMGAAQPLINIHLHSKYRMPKLTCLRALCLMAGSEALARYVSSSPKYLDILDFALRNKESMSLVKTAMISIKEISKDSSSIERITQRRLVSALGLLAKTTDPTMQTNLLETFANLSRKKAAKEQIVHIPEWPNVVAFADSFDPNVRREVQRLLCTMASGDWSEVCREALTVIIPELKRLQRSGRFDPQVVQTVIDFVNNADQIIKAQALIRGVLGRKRAARVRRAKLAQRESLRRLPTFREKPHSAAMIALEMFVPPTVVRDTAQDPEPASVPGISSAPQPAQEMSPAAARL